MEILKPSSKKYGRCCGCDRVLPAEVLEQVMFLDGHKHHGSIHHKLLCFTCIKKADEVGMEVIKDKEEFDKIKK